MAFRSPSSQQPPATVSSAGATDRPARPRLATLPVRKAGDPLTPNTIGEYELTELIGHGATGRVWRARHRSTDEVVAVKVLRGEFADDEQARARFLAEGRLLSDRLLPGVVRILAAIDDPTSPAIVMELIDAPTLRQVLTDDAPLDSARATALVLHLGSSLAAAHESGLVHGDVKPENVLVTGCGTDHETTVLSDFGLARVLEECEASRSRSQVIGTPHYAAPEIHAGGRSRAPADIYATGIILYELIVGHRPFDAATTLGVIQKHLNETPERTGDFSQALWDVVAGCLDKDPERRPTAASLTRELQRILDDDLLAAEALPTTLWRKAAADAPEGGRTRRRTGLLVAASATAALLVGVGAVAMATRAPGSDELTANAGASTAADDASDGAATASSPASAASSASIDAATPPLADPSAELEQGGPEPEAIPAPPAVPEPERAPEPEVPKREDVVKPPRSTTPTPRPPPAPPLPVGAQSSTRTTTLPDGRKLEVNLLWNRTAKHNDWQRVRFRVSGTKPYASNFNLYVNGKGVYSQALTSTPGGTWYGLSLRGHASLRSENETFLVQVYPPNRKPPGRLGFVEFKY